MITLLNKFDDGYVIQSEDVLDIADSYIGNNNLSEYVNDITISCDDTSKYDDDNRLVKFNIDDILENNVRLFKKLEQEYNIDEKYKTYYLNYFYLKQIYEVLTSISQKSKYDGKNDIRGFLYNYCKNVDLDDKSSLMLPMKIEASNEGLLTSYNYLNYTKLPGREAEKMHLEYLKKILLNYYRKNNFQVISPIELLNEMFPLIDMDELNGLLDQTKLSKIDRFNLGLPVTAKEYDSVQNDLNKRLIKINNRG